MMTRIRAAAVLLLLLPAGARADEYAAVEHQRQTVYHSPQKPGFTSWVGAWLMPDGSLMTSFTQATGPLKDRRAAPKHVQEKLNWPPAGSPGYDMTGLELKNVHLRSADQGKTWKPAGADSFQSCMNGVTGEAEAALADGTILRGVFGFYLPYDDFPKTGYLQRSSDGSKTWGKPEVLLDPKKYTAWPRRIRVLRDGRILVLMGVAPLPAGSHTRDELSKKLQPMLVVSSDGGKSWQGPIAAVPKDKPDGWTEEFDVAELDNGDLLAMYRRASDTKRWQGILRKSDKIWDAGPVGLTTLPHSGQPELLAAKEGPILHLATTGIHWTADAGKTWTPLKIPGAAYYPRSVQANNGRIMVLGHVGGDDAYGAVDQSVVMDSFRLEKKTAAAPDTGAAIEKGLRFLVKDAQAWKDKHNCASCHHAALVVWSMREAKLRGHTVDEKSLEAWTKWIAESGDGKTGVPRPAGIPKALNAKAVWFALALGADPEPDDTAKKGMAALLKTVKGDQGDKGFWYSWPDTRPPFFGHSDESMTVLAALALHPAAATDADAKTARDIAVKWLINTKSDDDSQSVAMRLVLWKRLGRDEAEIKAIAKRVADRQNADGGWSQSKGMSSDAWATGQALYALAHAAFKPDDPVIVRGRTFLVKTQRADGSWPMTSRPMKYDGKESDGGIAITGAGSAWAVLGLVRSRH